MTGEGHPEVGGQYVFFLGRLAPVLDYRIERAYQLKNGKVLPLDDGRPFSDYEGMSTTDFLIKVQAAISAGGPIAAQACHLESARKDDQGLK